MELPGELFTPQSILTLTGATGAVYVICAGLQHAFKFNPRWLALFISLILALYGTYETQPQAVANYLVGIVNGFLIYCSSVGVNSVAAQPNESNAVARSGTISKTPGSTERGARTFRSRWF